MYGLRCNRRRRHKDRLCRSNIVTQRGLAPFLSSDAVVIAVDVGGSTVHGRQLHDIRRLL